MFKVKVCKQLSVGATSTTKTNIETKKSTPANRMMVSVYLYQCFQIPPTSFWNGPNHKNLPRLVTNPSLRKLEAKGGPRTEESLLSTLKVFWDKSLRKKYFMFISDRRCLLWCRGWCVDQAGFLWWDRKMVACWRLIMLVIIMKAMEAMEDRNYWRLIITMMISYALHGSNCDGDQVLFQRHSDTTVV